MTFDLTHEQILLRDGAERFVRDHYGIGLQQPIRATELGFSDKNWSRLADLGWLALPLPPDIAGLDYAIEDVAILMEQFGRGLVLEPYVTTTILCAGICDHCESSAMRDRLLRAIADGTLRMALAYSELSEPFDPRLMIGTIAESCAKGFKLHGVKTMVIDGPSAQQLIVSARLSNGRPALFLVDPSLAGVELSAYPLVDGSCAADVRLEGIELPAESCLASGPAVESLLEDSLDRASIARSAEAVGIMEACLDVTSAYVKERRQFGQPIGAFQAVQHILADMFVETQEARSMLYHAMAHAGDPEPLRRRKAISLAKIAISRSSKLVSTLGIQLHGGNGVTDEYVISRYHRRLMVIETAFGDMAYQIRRYVALSGAA
jgi:alkylation response protein AidB-like acyl-CoA dehydrogenase